MLPEKMRLTVSERTYREIKYLIATREIAPGTPLVLRTIASRLGVSRMPVVEAIRRLERDGLVTVLPKWGATVKEWSHEEVLEAYCIRRALEGEAARFFVLRATDGDKRRLVELNNLFDQFAETDPVKCDETDIELHLHIARATRFGRLFELIENSKIETAMLFGLHVGSREIVGKRSLDYRKLKGTHKPIVKALLAKDPEAAKQAIIKHVDTALALLMKLNPMTGSDLRDESRTGAPLHNAFAARDRNRLTHSTESDVSR